MSVIKDLRAAGTVQSESVVKGLTATVTKCVCC